MTKEVVFVLDFGSPYTQLIAQRVRENHVFSRIVPYDISAKEIKLQKPKGIILSGGSNTTSKKKSPLPDKKIFKLNIPILGIGYGAKVIVKRFGGRVKSTEMSEFQRCELFIDDTRNLFWQMPSNITCWMSYADHIKKLPRAFRRTAHTQDNPIAAFGCSSKKNFGVSFHPEVVATQRGSQILGNFLYKICGCIGAWTMDSFVRETVNSIKKTVGKSKVILNLTASLDSSVAALLMNRAIKSRFKCIFIDNGLMLKDEVRQIRKIFNRNLNLNVKYIDRSKRFLQSLKGVVDPEDKKKIISNMFVRIFQEELKKAKGAEFLAQGTLCTGTAKSSYINISSKLKPLQPLKNLFRDEVRVVAKGLGLPDSIIFRQPFPETGLAKRIVGEITTPRLKVLREAQDCLVGELKDAGIYEQIWQSFAVLLPTRNVIAIRCIASVDGITTDWVRLPYELLEKISRRIISKIKGINRVVYDISSQPPATVEWE